MGMCLALTILGDENITRVLADPPLIWKVVAPEEPEMFESARAEQKRPGLLSCLFGRRAERTREQEFMLTPPEGTNTDLDKAWHGIHYLLTGSADEGNPPLDFLVRGGRAVGDVEVGYGLARALTSKQVREVSEALRTLSADALRARFDPGDMIAKEIYPEIWERSAEDDDPLGYLMENVKVLRDILEQAVSHRLGLVIHVT